MNARCKNHSKNKAQRTGSRRIDGSRQFWVSLCWWEGDKGKQSRGVAYAQNGELLDALKKAAPSVAERKRGEVGEFTIETPSGKTTNLLSDMMFNDIEYLERILEAWREVWLTVRPVAPSESDRNDSATSDEGEVATEILGSDEETEGDLQTELEDLQGRIAQLAGQVAKANLAKTSK